MPVVAVINSLVFFILYHFRRANFQVLANRFQIACFESQCKKSDMSDFDKSLWQYMLIKFQKFDSTYGFDFVKTSQSFARIISTMTSADFSVISTTSEISLGKYLFFPSIST